MLPPFQDGVTIHSVLKYSVLYGLCLSYVSDVCETKHCWFSRNTTVQGKRRGEERRGEERRGEERRGEERRGEGVAG